jgi:3-phosphoglycerate kinase
MIQYLSQQNPELFHNKAVLVRLDLNVPLTDGQVLASDASRIHASLPTLQYLLDAGARITIISHIGRKPEESLAPVVEYINKIPSLTLPKGKRIKLKTYITWREVLPFGGKRSWNLGENFITILPNLRSHSGEELNDAVFAQSLCEGQDYYINDAFAVSHRAHASVVGIPKLMGHDKCFAGFQLEREIGFLDQALHPVPPSLLIMGGAKFETKLPVIETLLPHVDHIIIGGALLNNFLQGNGIDIGDSLIDPDANISHLIGNPKIIIPSQVITVADDSVRIPLSMGEGLGVRSGAKILDIDSTYFKNSDVLEIIENAQTIIWNGPMGYYEGGFTAGTESLAHTLSTSSAVKIVGGGDSVALIEQLHLADNFDFLSTGGGAMLEYLAQGGSLPGIDILQ